MDSLLIRNARLDGQLVDILVEGGVYKEIGPDVGVSAERVLDAGGKPIVPPFYNMHTHAAMSLMRGYADDMELFKWLNEYIWPAERDISPEDVYHGTRLAILEMIRTGSIFFNDMYWYPDVALQAVEEMGVRAALGRFIIEESPGRIHRLNIEANNSLEKAYERSVVRDRVFLTWSPHAIYTVSEATLRRIGEQAMATGEHINIHASETIREVEDALKKYGMSPIAWLDKCGVLGPKTVLAHCVHLSEADIKLIRERGATVVHMPVSNAKLGSGNFNYRKVVELGGCNFTIGTDGNASNNNLSMFDEVKAAALVAKLTTGDPACGKDDALWKAATRGGAQAFGINGGIIAEGAVADALLIDASNVLMVPEHYLVANMVYSADSSCVDTVICGGRVLMEGRRIDGEADIIAGARERAQRLDRIQL
ncbi:MAG: amidohydrolase [Lentisphaerae bacterium]|nr:amidohydrolase [Lentisphaerota bacterium]